MSIGNSNARIPTQRHYLQLHAVCCTFRTSLCTTWNDCKEALELFKRDPETSVVALQSVGRLSSNPVSVAHFLYHSHGSLWLEPKMVGQFITAPLVRGQDVGMPDVGLAREDILSAYVESFDFSSDSPPQALRRILARTRMPQRTKRQVIYRGRQSNLFRHRPR